MVLNWSLKGQKSVGTLYAGHQGTPPPPPPPRKPVIGTFPQGKVENKVCEGTLVFCVALYPRGTACHLSMGFEEKVSLGLEGGEGELALDLGLL